MRYQQLQARVTQVRQDADTLHRAAAEGQPVDTAAAGAKFRLEMQVCMHTHKGLARHVEAPSQSLSCAM